MDWYAELKEDMNRTLADVGHYSKDEWFGDVQVATYGDLRPGWGNKIPPIWRSSELQKERVSFDPESFDYLDHILNLEFSNFAKNIKEGYTREFLSKGNGGY